MARVTPIRRRPTTVEPGQSVEDAEWHALLARLVPRILSYCARVEGGCATPCLMWTGSLRPDGYGQFETGSRRTSTRKSWRPHIVMWEAKHGRVPNDRELHHRCRQRACCEPSHLVALTHAEHMAEHAQEITHCIHGHEFTPANTYTHPKRGTRHCRACIAIRNAARFA